MINLPPQRRRTPRRERRFRAAQNAILADTLSDFRRIRPTIIPLHQIARNARTGMLINILARPSQQLLKKFHLPPEATPIEVLTETVRMITEIERVPIGPPENENFKGFGRVLQLGIQLDKYLVGVGLREKYAAKYKDKIWNLIKATDRFNASRP